MTFAAMAVIAATAATGGTAATEALRARANHAPYSAGLSLSSERGDVVARTDPLGLFGQDQRRDVDMRLPRSQ